MALPTTWYGLPVPLKRASALSANPRSGCWFGAAGWSLKAAPHRQCVCMQSCSQNGAILIVSSVSSDDCQFGSAICVVPITLWAFMRGEMCRLSNVPCPGSLTRSVLMRAGSPPW